jgi:hypothetical protein
MFTLLYFLLTDHFDKMSNEKHPELIDYFFLGTTIQSGVGYTSLTPITALAKFVMILQQMFMLSINVFLLYMFTN